MIPMVRVAVEVEVRIGDHVEVVPTPLPKERARLVSQEAGPLPKARVRARAEAGALQRVEAKEIKVRRFLVVSSSKACATAVTNAITSTTSPLHLLLLPHRKRRKTAR